MPLPFAKPEELDLDPHRIAGACRRLEWFTKRGEIPGGAILVGRRGRTIEPRFFGRQGPEPDAPAIRRDGLFLLASITKPVVYTAALRLVERGELNLSAPVAAYLPDFAAHHKEETLVQHLFTHTSGLPDMLENNLELRRRHAPLAEFIRAAQRDTVPLFRAGTNLSYQSMGTLVVAELAQRLSGQPIRDLLRKEVFEPLGMRDSALGSQGLERARIVRVQPSHEHGDVDYNWNSVYWQELGSPWGGMFSSPEDMALLCQTLLDGGRRSDDRLLTPLMVERMTTNRLDEYPDLPEPLRRTQPWGLGWRMNHPGTSGSWSDLLDRQVFGHTGATGTMLWIDRRREGFALIFTTGERSRAPGRLVQLSNELAAAFL